ncbi:hypothetical protein ACMWRF_000443 [Enterobacter hormaechei]|nr:hypothetical protein [Enterobacter hormaechei]
MRILKFWLFLLLATLSSNSFASDECKHQDGAWEHRVSPSGELDVAIKRVDANTQIRLGGVPGKLQLINIIGNTKDVRTAGEITRGGVKMKTVKVSISSDKFIQREFYGFISVDSGGMIVIPFKGMVNYVLSSNTLNISYPLSNGGVKHFSFDISEIPLGTEHSC